MQSDMDTLDATLWDRREQSQQMIALHLRLNRYALRDLLRGRGWAWKPGGHGVSRAPCRACHAPTAVDDLTLGRECRGCAGASRPVPTRGLTPNQRLAREERRKRRARIGTPEWNERYMRPGGPECRPVGVWR